MKKIKELFTKLRNKLGADEDSLSFLQRLGIGKSNETEIENSKREVLKQARRFVYPWRLPKHKSALISTILIIVLVITFLTGVGLSIYRYKSESELVYQVSRLIPFPLGKVGSDYVQYDDYLFELRSLKHVYGEGAQTFGREPVSFESKEGQELLVEIRRDALLKAQENALVKQLARSNGVEVTGEEINNRVNELRERYGGDERFRDFLQQYYGWSERISISNLSKGIELGIMKQKLSPILDTENRKRAESILKRVKENPDKFKDTATEVSEDASTSQSGGDLGLKTIEDLAVKSETFAEVASDLKVGETSDVVATDIGFQIIKKLDEKDGKVHVSHIQINYFDIDNYLKEQLEKTETVIYGELGEIKNPGAVLHY